MKYILSPYDDENFNKYLILYIKKQLKLKCRVYSRDDSSQEYFLDDSKDKRYTQADIINSVELVGRTIRYANQKLVNHAVYDLGQRFWYDVFKCVNNIIRKIYLEFQKFSNVFSIQQRKLSHEKRAHNRYQGAKK